MVECIFNLRETGQSGFVESLSQKKQSREGAGNVDLMEFSSYHAQSHGPSLLLHKMHIVARVCNHTEQRTVGLEKL